MRMDASNPNQIEQLIFQIHITPVRYTMLKQTACSMLQTKAPRSISTRLELTTGDKIQYTDVIGGNFRSVPFREDGKIKACLHHFFQRSVPFLHYRTAAQTRCGDRQRLGARRR